MIFAIVMLFSCENDIKDVNKVAGNEQDTLPGIWAYDIEYYRTDSGRLQMVLTAPEMVSYDDKKNPYSEFPKGFKIYFFDDDSIKKAYVEAQYGIDFKKKKYLEARNDVVVINFLTHEQLNTENLVWDQKKKKIYARTFVKITTPDKIIFGDSLHANEDFSKRTIFNIRKSEIEINENE
jgi:LPS export ABC transporter protein LptC